MRIRDFNLITMIGLLAFLICAVNVWADEGEKPTASADIGVFTKYMWRGFELSDDSFVIQPSATVGYKGFSFNMWGNLDTDVAGTSGDAKWNETDMTLSYDTSFGPVAVGAGYIYYALDGVDDAEEFYVTGGLDVFLSPTLTAYREIAELQGWYINMGISHSFELPRGMTLDLAGSVGYYLSEDDNFVEFDDDLNPTTKKYKNLHDGQASVGLTVPLDEYFVLTPMIAYSFPLSDEADNLITAGSISNNSGFVYGGITLSIAF